VVESFDVEGKVAAESEGGDSNVDNGEPSVIGLIAGSSPLSPFPPPKSPSSLSSPLSPSSSISALNKNGIGL
jgi:hypothetical protein